MQGENPFQISSSSKLDAEAALREAERWLRPLPEKELRRELVALHLKTVSQKTAGADLDLQLEIYLSELQKFPGDITRDVLRRWSGKFFPAFAELREAIATDRRNGERRLRIAALRLFLDGDKEDKPKGKPPTDEQMKRARNHFRPEHSISELDEEKIKGLEAVDKLPESIAHRNSDGNWISPAKLARIAKGSAA